MALGSHHRFMTELIRRSATNRRSRTMSLTRVQHISISLDVFATGEGQSFDAPFGHAGERLHEWMFAAPAGWREHRCSPGSRPS
jgi:hypothetical protein